MKLSHFFKNLKIVTFILLFSITFIQAGRRSEDEFWSQEDTEKLTEEKGVTQFPGESFVQAGLMAYGNYGYGEDEFTGGLKISASFRDMFDYMFFRMDGFLGVGGPAEGVGEVQFVLIKGLNGGLGFSYTDRLGLSPRLGLYVEDQANISRRAGLYLLRDDGGGIEINWPFDKQWDISVDLGVEKENDHKYTRFLSGLSYKF